MPPAFSELNWGQFDVDAIVVKAGITVVASSDRQGAHAWLAAHNYPVRSIDCAGGIAALATAIGQLFQWELQFGYAFGASRFNLDALHDGFGYSFSEEPAWVLELLNADVCHQEDAEWFYGFLSIAQNYSREQLALGRRFFLILLLDSNSRLINQEFETSRVPSPYQAFGRASNPVEQPPP